VTEIERTNLPGVGTRFEFTTGDGRRIGVIHHRSGRREVFVCPEDDPDTAIVTLDLSDDEAHDLVDLLGGSRVVENLSQLQHQIEGLAIDWLTIDPNARYVGRTIGDARIRTRTGVSVVAVLRGGDPYPAPGPEFRMDADDVLVVVGTSEGIAGVREILRSG
jgi:TrkA domain protein